MVGLLQVNGLSVEVGGRMVVSDATFSVRPRETVGLVGRNGAGKTSLLKVLGGAAQAHSGTITRTGGLGYLPQDPKLDGVDASTAAVTHILGGRGLDEMMDRMEKIRLQLEEAPTDDNVRRYANAQDAFDLAGGYAAESEARAIASGLGLGDDKLDLPLSALSGGQRRRVEVARILFAGSDVLLLDEPTNHLDADARDWMLRFLRQYRGALIVISHDLGLLDESIDRVLHLDRVADEDTGVLHEYKGTYTQYIAAREAHESRMAKQAARTKSEIDRLQNIVDRFGAKATKASMAQSIEKRIDRLRSTAVEGPKGARQLKVRFPEPPASGRTSLTVTELAKSYGALDVFIDVSFDVGRGERLLILGLNGAGKTSMLKILAGQSEADLGEVTWGHNVVVGYYAQEHEGIRAGFSLLDHMREQAGTKLDDTELRSLLGMFGITGDKVHQDASTLSGGEKTKLALAQLVAGRNNVLLLDEPTNNLDPGSRDAVADALGGWPGTIILVSHDADFVRALEPDRILVMPEGDIDHWREDLLELVTLA